MQKLSEEILAIEHRTNSLQFSSGFGIAKRKAAQLAEKREAEHMSEETTCANTRCQFHDASFDGHCAASFRGEPINIDECTGAIEQDSNLALVSDALVEAKTQHPFFADRFCGEWMHSDAEANLMHYRLMRAEQDKAQKTSATTVILCEIAEAVEAYSRGDLPHAKAELAECAAVILRMMEMVDKQIKKQESKI
jgi:hypothetical protein